MSFKSVEKHVTWLARVFNSSRSIYVIAKPEVIFSTPLLTYYQISLSSRDIRR